MTINDLLKDNHFHDFPIAVRDIRKMRETLLNHLQEKGIEAEIRDEKIFFIYEGMKFEAKFNLGEMYAECLLFFATNEPKYIRLKTSKKNILANHINTALQNHTIVTGYTDCLCMESYFHFTNNEMMIHLFHIHFKELLDSLNELQNILFNHYEALLSEEDE